MADQLLAPPDSLDDRDEETRAHPVKPHKSETEDSSSSSGADSSSTSPGALAAKDQKDAAARDSKKSSLPTVKSEGPAGGSGSGSFWGKAGAAAKKRKAMLIAGGGVLAVGFIILAFILFLLTFKLNHIKNLFIDYQFAAFHRSLSMRLNHLILEDAILVTDSSALPDGARRASLSPSKLYERLRGFERSSALKELGERGLKLDFDDGGKLRSYVNETTGERTWRGREVPTGETGRSLPTSEFLSELKGSMTELQYDKSNFFRRKSFNDVLDRSGIRLAKFREWFNGKYSGKEATAKQAQTENIKEQVEDVSKNAPVPNDAEVRNVAEESKANVINGEAPATKESIFKRFSSSEKISEISTLAFVVTIYCIFYDIGENIKGALNHRIDGFMTTAADLNTKADQQKAGKAPAEGINAAVSEYDGFEQSASYQRAAGEPVTGEDLAEEDYPTTIFGLLPDNIKTIVGVYDAVKSTPLTIASGGLCLVPGIRSGCNKLGDVVTGNLCRYVLNPYAQGALAGVDLILALSSLGTTASGERATAEIIKDSFKLVGNVSIGYIIFGKIIPSFINEISGIGPAGLTNSVDKTNRVSAGDMLLKNEAAAASGAHPISNEEASTQTQTALNYQRKMDAQKGPLYALFNLNNQRTFGSRFLAKIPTSPTTLATSLHGAFSMIFNPMNLLKTFSTPATAAVTDDFYNVQQWGWSDAEVTGDAPDYDFLVNSQYVEANMERLKKDYSMCMSVKLGDRLMEDKYDKCSDTNNNDLRRYGMYVLDCYSVEQLATLTTDTDTFRSSQCSELTGGTNVTTTTGGGGGGILPVGEYFQDSSSTACPSGTSNATGDGLTDGVYTVIPAQNIKIRICNVGGINVNVLIASQINNLLTESAKANLVLGGGGWRNNAEQIELRKKNCVTSGVANDYDIYQKPANECRPPTAIPTPGGSRHEWGLAIDFRSGGVTIGSGSASFNWLSSNAVTYGLYNLPSESWHWSVDGH